MVSERVSVKKSSKEMPLVSFANGVIKKSSRKRKLVVGAFRDSKYRGANKKKKVMVAESDKMVYRGDNFGPLSGLDQPVELYVAEVNTTTGKMTFYPTEIFNMHAVSQEDLAREELPVATMSFGQKSDMLTDAFGSGKSKRALQKRQKNKMADSAVSSAMGSVISSAVTAQRSLPATPVSQHASSAIPPFNMAAESPAGVYSLGDIIGPAEMESLKNLAHDFCYCEANQLKEWKDNQVYSLSVLSRLAVLPMDPERRLRQASLLLYLHCLITLFHLKYDHMRRKDPLPAEWPDMVKQMMLNRFTSQPDGAKRCFPARLKDLLLSHILVLCLMMDNYSCHLANLQKDLKVSAKKLQVHARALGCKLKSESLSDASGVKVVTYTAMLKVPLTFPDPSKSKGKQGRK